jgi:LemA protein
MALLGWIIGGGVFVALVAVIMIYYYNRFTVLENRIDNSLSQIDVQLKKRADLVPNLVKVVQGYAKFEKGVLENVTKARSMLMKTTDMSQKVKAGDMLQSALGRLFAVAEAYPTLKANENYLQLQTELSSIEDKIAYSRQYYNDSIMSYDNASERFPGVLFFKLYGKKRKEYLQMPEKDKGVPNIDLTV